MSSSRSSPTHVVVMGVAGVGKTTVATRLADHLGWVLAEADDFHPPGNVDKMAGGVPLDDDDRWPWLRAVRDWMSRQAAAGHDTVVSCSALRRAYRDVLREADGRVRFAHLSGDRRLVSDRMARRRGHFMPPDLVASQYRTLEPLEPDEDGLTVAADAPPGEIVRQVASWLDGRGGRGRQSLDRR
jgi:gluconokinase